MNEINSNSILIVDDYPKNIQFLAGILAGAGYDVAYAVSGIEALEWVTEKKFSLILLDIMMPEMDGFEVCSRLKTNTETADIPIIFLTAKTETESISRAFEIGAVDYLIKPINATELLARVKTHINLQKQKQELAELNQLKDKLFSILAHDLKSPFNTIIGFSDLLSKNLRTYTTEKSENLIRLINISSKQTYGLLENLLEWSRNQIRKNTARIEKFDLNQVACELVDFYTNELIRKEIDLINNIEANFMISADKNMITFVLRNLLSNALKFTDKNGTIELIAKKTSNYYEISVSDNGVGIPSDKKDLIFVKDLNITTRGTQNEKGTGLGLLLCREFIERHNGDLNFESAENNGTRFYFTIPAIE